MPELNLWGGYYTDPSKPLSVQNSINLMPVLVEEPGLSQNALIGTKGLTVFATLTGIGRGAWVMDSIPYEVNGTQLFSLDAEGASTLIGTIEGTSRVSMADSGSKLCIVVPGGKGYVFDGATLVEITDPDYLTSDTVVYKDGFFIFTATAGNVFFVSALNDPTDIDPLDFGTAEVDPDKIVGAHVDHNELFILGEETTEVFQNVGGSGFPFQRIPGAVISKGCFARFTPIEFDNSFVFVGGGKGEGAAIWRVTSASSAVKITTDAMDNEIQKFTKEEIAESFSFSFAIDGQFVVGFTFTSSREGINSATYCYNWTSQKWFQIQSGLNANKWRINSMVKAYDKILVSDSIDGTIGFLDDVFTEYGNMIKRERTTQPFVGDFKSLYFPEIELVMEQGVGLEDGSDPQVRMSYSDDSGRNFTPEKAVSFGKVGDYERRSIWRRQGSARTNRVMRFVVTDPVKVSMIALYANVEQGYG